VYKVGKLILVVYYVGNLGRTNSPTSVRHEDDLGFIRIWATPPNRLVFWDGTPSPHTNWYQSNMASKMTTTTKFELEKFDEKSNFMLRRKMLVTSFLVKEGTHKTLLGIKKKMSETISTFAQKRRS